MTIARPDQSHQPLDSAVHRALLLTMIERGYAASIGELAESLGYSDALIRESLTRLESNHGVVTHPGTLDPWVIHPFSTTPTLFCVTNSERGWWAPCIWCALGIGVRLANVSKPSSSTTVLQIQTTE